jgi:hypothetical protein
MLKRVETTIYVVKMSKIRKKLKNLFFRRKKERRRAR